MKEPTGDGYINCALFILGHNKGFLLWQEFKEEFDIENKHTDPLDVACWVGSWLIAHKKEIKEGIK